MNNSISTRSRQPFTPAEPWDAVIVGAGAAGLYTALCLPREWRVLLLTKEPLNLSASGWAQGGIAAAIAPGDSADLHVVDTLKAGAGLCERSAVEFLVEHAPECIESLVDLGVAFDRSAGALAMTREAAHSRPRVLHAADRTGKAVVTTLAEQVLQRDNIQVCSPVFVLRLMMVDGRCQGVGFVQEDELQWVRSPRVILATGGGGQVFSHTTNPALSTGDGIALAHQAGAQLRDLEFFQFHPTALMKPGAPCFLISEAVRGEGAHLVDDAGTRFAFDYHPDGELAPRDVVSRAIFQHLQNHHQEHVWLDLRPIPKKQVRYRFPNIIRVCQKWGVDLFEGPIPVAPAAHYWMGGIVTDHWGQTTVPGLYAVGEAASTGVHGANRLASNSLLECVVFGRRLAQAPTPPPVPERSRDHASRQEAKAEIASRDTETKAEAFAVDAEVDWETERSHIAELRCSLAETLWTGAGICRDQSGMKTALTQVADLRAQFDRLSVGAALRSALQPDESNQICSPPSAVVRAWGELANLLTIGELILQSALFRQESRGGHYRVDFPESAAAWRCHTLVEGEQRFRSDLLEET